MSQNEPYYWILIPESCMQVAVNKAASAGRLTDTSPFRPRYNDAKNREEVSMCDAEFGEVTPEEAAKRLNDYQQTAKLLIKKYTAAAKLTKTNLKEIGFKPKRDNTPYLGHTNAILKGKLTDKDNRLKRNLLMNAANKNGIIRIDN